MQANAKSKRYKEIFLSPSETINGFDSKRVVETTKASGMASHASRSLNSNRLLNKQPSDTSPSKANSNQSFVGVIPVPRSSRAT